MLDAVLRDTKAELIQTIGHTATLYRKNPDKR
jgi:RNA-binding protein YhbY